MRRMYRGANFTDAEERAEEKGGGGGGGTKKPFPFLKFNYLLY